MWRERLTTRVKNTCKVQTVELFFLHKLKIRGPAFRRVGRNFGDLAMAEEGSAVLTEQEAAVYDRQIRVWGAEAQRRWATVCWAFEPGHHEGINVALAALMFRRKWKTLLTLRNCCKRESSQGQALG